LFSSIFFSWNYVGIAWHTSRKSGATRMGMGTYKFSDFIVGANQTKQCSTIVGLSLSSTATYLSSCSS
jgi:hypothetical protein